MLRWHKLYTIFGLLVLLVVGTGFFTSCKNKWERKLSEKKLEALLAELYVTQSLVEKSYPYAPDSVKQAYSDIVLHKYNITQQQFDSIIAYYAHYKANRLSAVLTRASEQVNDTKDRYANIASISTSTSSTPRHQYITSSELATVIPEKQYPSLVGFQRNGVSCYYSVSVSDSIPAGSTISVTVDIKGIRLPHQVEKSHHIPKLILSYDAPKNKFLEEIVSMPSPGSYTASITTSKLYPPGVLTFFIYAPPQSQIRLAYVLKLSVSYTPGDNTNNTDLYEKQP